MNAMRLHTALRQLYKDITYAIEDGTLPESTLDHPSMVEARGVMEEHQSACYQELMQSLLPHTELKLVEGLAIGLRVV